MTAQRAVPRAAGEVESGAGRGTGALIEGLPLGMSLEGLLACSDHPKLGQSERIP